MPGPVLPAIPEALAQLRVGIDVVQVSRITESVERFGERFLRRLFTADELAYALDAPAVRDQRLAARFAVKEAALKALRLADAGVPWTEIEVARHESGDCELRLHGAAREAVSNAGFGPIAVSMSHEGDYAVAIVTAVPKH